MEELSNNGGVWIKEFQNWSHSERSVLLSSLLLCKFPTVAVTNYCKLGGLKQHRCILLQCCGSEV